MRRPTARRFRTEIPVVFAILVVVVFGLTGLRIRLIPGVEGTVTVARTGVPLDRAIVNTGIPWKWGEVGKLFHLPPGGSRWSGEGVDQRECVTDSLGRFRFPPAIRVCWTLWVDYGSDPQLLYVMHPLYTAAAVSSLDDRRFVMPMRRLDVKVLRISEYQRRRLSGGVSLHSWGSQASYATNLEYFYWEPGRRNRAPGMHRPWPGAYRDFAEIRKEWTRLARVEHDDPESYLAPLRRVEHGGE